MEINHHEKEKRVDIWLTKAEANDTELREKLKPFYAECKAKKIQVVVFCSGTQSLFDCTLALLRYNRDLSARKEVEAERLLGVNSNLQSHRM